MADIQITADYTDLQLIQRELVNVQGQAKKSASIFEREFNKVERDLNKVARAATSTAKAYQTYYSGLAGVTSGTKSASASAQVFATQMKNLDQDIKMAADAAEHYNKQLLGISTSSKSARDSASVFSTELKRQEAAQEASVNAIRQQEAALEALRQKYNPMYTAMLQYERVLDELNMAQREGIITSQQYEAQLESLSREFTQFKNGTAAAGNQFVAANTMAQRSTNQLGVVMQQTGYQVGDFLVQVQSGTNWMVAFGQQATQLVGVLPLLSGTLGVGVGTLTALSAGLGIAIPLLTAFGAYWLRASEEAKKSEGKLSELEQRLKSLDNSLQDWLRTKEAAALGLTVDELLGTQELGKAEANLKAAKDELKEIKDLLSVETFADFGKTAEQLEMQRQVIEAIASESAEYQAALEKVMEAENRLADLRRKHGEEQYKRFSEEYRQLNDQIELINVANQYGQESVEYIRAEAEQRRQTYAIQVDQMDITEAQKIALKNVYDIILDNQTATDVFRQKMSDTADQAARLATNMENSAMAWSEFQLAQITAQNPGQTTGTGIDSLDIQSQGLGAFLPPSWGGDGTTGSTSRRGSGGGGRSKKEDTGIGSFAMSLLDDQQAEIDAWRTDSLAKLQEFNAMELELLGGHNAAKVLIEEEYQRKIDALQQADRSRSLSLYGDLFGSMAQLAEQGGKKTFGIWKAFSIAQATINSYRAFTEVLADPSFVGRPWERGIAAAAVLASGLAQVSSIASTTFGGGSGGGKKSAGGSISSGGSSNISTPTAATEAPQQVLIQGLEPGMRLSPEELQEIFDQIYEENGRRGTIFKVEI